MSVTRKIQVRRGTASQWSTVNPVLSSGEFGYDTTNKVLKIGDGSTAWASLAEAGLSEADIQDLIDTSLEDYATTADVNAALEAYLSVSEFTPVGADFPNLFIGDNSGNETMTTSPAPDSYRGSSNLGVGKDTLASLTTGYRNVAIGRAVLGLCTTGYHNTGCGNGVLQKLTSGQYNTGLGIGALLETTTGANNTGLGGDALYWNTTGSRNNAIGRNALFNNTTGDDNCAFGHEALYDNTTGFFNSAFGRDALGDCTTGSRNSGVGLSALRQLTTGISNVGIGDSAGNTITTGSNNVMIGLAAGSGLTTGSNNVVIGGATLSAADSGHVVISTGNGTRRLSFDGTGLGTFPGQVIFETVTRFGAPLRDTEGANRLRFLLTGDKSTEVYSGGNYVRLFDLNGNENATIDYYRAQFLGNLVFRPEASETLSGNRQMTFELTSDTSVRIKVRGSDGITRVSSGFSLS